MELQPGLGAVRPGDHRALDRVGAGYLGPEAGRIASATERSGVASAEVQERIHRIFLVSRIELVLLLCRDLRHGGQARHVRLGRSARPSRIRAWMRYDPAAVETRWQEIWEREGVFDVPNPGPGDSADDLTYVLEMLPYPSGELHMGHVKNYTMGDVVTLHRRRHGLPGDAPDGLRRVRPAGRERGHPLRPPPGRVHAREHRRDPPPDEADGLVDRLEARALDGRPGVLPLDAVDLPAPVRGRPGLPQERGRQVVPERPDRARERAGDRRALRALRSRGRGAHARAVVVQDHRLRRPPAGRPRRGALARAGRDDAAQLDRPLAGRRGRLRPRRRHRPERVHDPARHALRRHVLRARAGASAGDRAGRRRRARAGRGRLRAPHRRPLGGRARRGAREDRRLHRPVRHQPGQRRADPGLGGRLRAGGVRHRRHHGRAGPRRARLRVRAGARARDPAGGRSPRRRGRRPMPPTRRTPTTRCS